MPADAADALTDAERARLAVHVTDLDGGVFALVGLPEVVKGALFARYSRSRSGLRRLLVDEFGDALDAAAGAPGAETPDGRAARLYARMFDEYGDDSVAQLGGAHVAVEGASNVLTKVLERGRLAAYLEQSTRYVPFDDHVAGRRRYHRPAELDGTPLAARYAATLDAVFDTYSSLIPHLTALADRRLPPDPLVSAGVRRATVRAQALDVLRGLLPAATTANVGIAASGQAYESLLLHLAEHPLAEARATGAALLPALRRVIPALLTRVDRPDRGGVWAHYLARTRADVAALAAELLGDAEPDPVDEVTLVAWDPDAETDLLVGILSPHTALPEAQVRRRVVAMNADERLAVVRAFAGERGNRRHKPGRALERVTYRFEVLGDYGAFRDLQRHRMLTVDWQLLTTRHGALTPPEVDEAGVRAQWDRALEREAELAAVLDDAHGPAVAQYAVGFAYRIRYALHLNARAALQLLELRTTPQGHPSYRRVCQRMHTLIAEQAGHHAVAALMSFVDHSADATGRLAGERAAEARRAATATGTG